MTIFFKIVAVLIFIAAIVTPISVNKYRKSQTTHWDESYLKVNKKYTIIGVVFAIVLFVFSCAFVIIPTGFTGVKSTFGQIDSTTMQNGFNWKLPFIQSVERMNNKQQDILFDGKVWSETNGRTTIYYDQITVTYQINSNKSSWIYANVSDYEDNLISQSLVASAVKSSSKTLSDTEATNRAVIEPLVQNNIQKSLDEKYGEKIIYVNKVVINNADFEDSYNKAIAAKQKAQLKAEKQEIENQKAIEKAKAEANVIKTNATAEAEAKLIAAEAEAKANNLLERSLTDKILKEMWIKKWNGQLPQYVAGDSGSIMFGINTD